VKSIEIDEFAVAKGHTYTTIVVDLNSGRVIHTGDEKGSDALDKFREKIKKKRVNMEACYHRYFCRIR
jgi:transposase